MLLCGLLAFCSHFASAQLSGNYTVDSSGTGSSNYLSVIDAVKDLYKSGVNGSVVFSIAKNQYNGQVKFTGPITGASSTNTVLFKSSSGIKEDVLLTTSRDTIILNMQRVAHVSFQDLSIEAVDTIPTRAVFLTKSSEYNRFKNCNISLFPSSSRRQTAVVSCKASSHNRWEKCEVSNGFFGFSLFGTSGSKLGESNSIMECVVSDFFSNGIVLYHQNHARIEGCEVQSASTFWDMSGLVNARSVGTTINANVVTTPYSPMNMIESNVVVRGDSIHITNNVFIATSNYGTCLLHDQSQRVNYLHNYMESKRGDAISMYTDNLSDIQVANNIFKGDGNGWTAMNVYVNDTTSVPLYWDHNDYDFRNYSYFMYGRRGMASFADYQGMYGGRWNKNSLTVDPEWDYNINRTFSLQLNNAGVDMGIDKDIDGNTRPNSNDQKIDIGPNDYWLAPIDLDVYAISGPLTVDLSSNTVSAVFKNAGTDEIKKTDAYVEYSVDSGKTWVKDTLKIKSLAAGKSINFTFTKRWIPTRSGNFQLSVRISPPISQDPDSKDQIDIQLCSGYQGNYTVGKNGDFKDLEEAFDILRCGVSGPLVFDIKAGTYAFNARLSEISGASASNTITVRGAHADSVTIYSTSSLPTVYMDGTDFFRFERLTLENRSNAGMAIHMLNEADHNQFIDCRIVLTSLYPSWNSFGLSLAEDPTNTWNPSASGSYNVFRNNYFKGGYGNAVINGNGARATRNNQFYDNQFISGQGFSVNVNYNDSLYFRGNTCDSMLYSWSNALSVQNSSNFVIEANTIFGGINVYNGNSSGWNGIDQSSISNNEIVADDYPQTIYMSNSNYVDVKHNSTSYLGAYSGMAFYYCSSIDFRNNILAQKSGNTVLLLESTSFTAFDFNNYTHNAQNLAEINRTAYADLTALKGFDPEYNQNSTDEDPDWINPSRELRPGSKFPDLFAPGVGIAADIEGTSRCKYFTALGAYEISKTQAPVRADFIAPDTLWLGSPSTLQNKLSPSIEYGSTWLVNGKEVSDSLHLVYEPSNTGLDTIMLIMDNCSGPDSVTKHVFVSRVLKAPVVNFSASSVSLYTEEPFQLFDLSTYGPNEWSWDITPKMGYSSFLGISTNTFSIDSTLKSPQGTFFLAGDYTVKLKASNSRGSDSITKTLFIRVRESASMCGAQTESNGAYGTLLDDGGIDNNYSKGLNDNDRCTYRIEGCHGALDFDFKTFQLASGDYLKIYDGEDEYGKPLWDAANYPNGMTGSLGHASIPSSMVAASGNAFVIFETSDFSATAEGFAIDWTAQSGSITPPSAAISSRDTVCVGLPFVMENASTGGWSFTQWDLDGNGSYDAIGNKVVVTPTVAQTIDIKLRANSACAGRDSVVKRVVVENARTTSGPSFSTSDTLTVAGKRVTLTGDFNYCVGAVKWRITPAHYNLLDDATLSQSTLPVAFTESGKYSVELIAENPFGKDSVLKTNLIRVIKYCAPAVTNVNNDLGISRVQFNEIDHRSTVGEAGYADYTEQTATVEPGYRYPITLSRNTTGQPMNRKVWIDWNIDGDFNDAGELVVSEKGTSSLVLNDTVRVPGSARQGNTIMRVATNLASLNNTPCGPHMFGEFEDYTIEVTEDKTPPVITLAGKIVDTIEVLSNWTEPGYSAYDLVQGNLTSQVVVTNNLDEKVTGSYLIEYELKDQSGNSMKVFRTVVVADRTLPSISLVGKDTFFIQINEPVTDPALNFSDNYDATLSPVRNGAVDNTELGFYPVEYCVTDASGNGPVCVKVVIHVGDSIAPVATLNGNNPEIVDVYSTYTDAGISVTENHEYTTVTSGSWTGSTDQLGTFEIIYTVRDKAGNEVVVTREIQVVDRIAPELASASTVYVPRWSAFDASSDVAFEDNYYSSTELTVSIVNNSVDVNSIGNYEVEYEVSDPSGNKATIVVPVIVVETQETVGIDEKDASSIKLYPNPTNGILHMEFELPDEGRFQISVRNSIGQEVYTLSQNNGGNFTETIDLHRLPASMYYVVVRGEGYELIEKFVLTD